MQVLVDEGMPVQILGPLRQNRGHAFHHIDELNWKGRLDQPLFEDASARGYEAILTLDVNQLSDIDECRALRRSGLHHVNPQQGRAVRGLTGPARVIASVVVAMPYVLDDLEEATNQRVVELSLLSAARRHHIYDPRKERERFPYWR